jgi:transposase
MIKQEEISTIKDCIASWMRQSDEMEMRYQGVRPSYVSTDLAILEERIERYRAKLAEMEGEAG